MRRQIAGVSFAVTVALSLGMLIGLGGTSAVARATAPPAPTRSISVAGNGVAMYPAFTSPTTRYGVTTTSATAGMVTVNASTTDPSGRVWVDGQPEVGGTATLTGLSSGDEISVFIKDSAGRTAYALIYLPAGFPTMTVVTKQPGIAPGDVFLNPSDFSSTNFSTIVDNNGVPVYVRTDAGVSLDFKRQPNGDYSVFEPSNPGGGQILELNGAFKQVATFRTVGLSNTDGHDSILLPNGDRWLLATVPHPVTGNTDAVIQEQDKSGKVLFQWNSGDYPQLLANSMVSMADYIHLNSIALMSNGDILASFRHLSQVVEIATSAHNGFKKGDIVWSLGGRDPSLTLSNDPSTSNTGPCAQHDATVLSNGDILMFDDGSEPLGGSPVFCVDPTNPDGPAIERPQTRVAEFSIDPTNTTARLVWSYSVPGRDVNFEGSAQRLPNGNTLVGWGNISTALVTEVNSEGQAVWELRDSPGLFSYRAYRFPAPDAIPPAVDVSQPAKGATYAFGQSVSSDFSCTDRGGSNLQSCAGSVTEGARVNTAWPGVHTFKVVAKDGAGNTTTVTRTYHVGPAPYQPDAQIKKAGGAAYTGSNIYAYPGVARQDITQSIAKAGRSAVAQIRLQNDGTRTDRITVRGTEGTARFQVSYFAGTKNVTARVTAGTYRTPRLASGVAFSLRVKVTRTVRAKAGTSRTVTVSATSAHDAAMHDAVATIVRATR